MVIDLALALSKFFEKLRVGDDQLVVVVVGDGAGVAQRQDDLVRRDAMHAEKARDIRNAGAAGEHELAVALFCAFKDKSGDARCGLAFLLGDEVVHEHGVFGGESAPGVLSSLRDGGREKRRTRSL